MTVMNIVDNYFGLAIAALVLRIGFPSLASTSPGSSVRATERTWIEQ